MASLEDGKGNDAPFFRQTQSTPVYSAWRAEHSSTLSQASLCSTQPAQPSLAALSAVALHMRGLSLSLRLSDS